MNQDNASTVFTNSLNDLKLASRENTAGRAIFFFVKAKSIGSVGKGPWWGPDHWIMLTSSIQVRASAKSTWTNIEASALANTDIGTYQIQFWIYTWGFYSQIGPNNHRSTTIKVSTVNDFLDYFYGFISATPPK
ncbi:hypothetical protein [Oleiphilus messinensis]|uniref:hypothetical protein n=1 Tax=Oleiphilus messinensis TaxID=141451 RepID=UPI0012FAE6D2|nr:hypothetical protein [Oleiphilus messinensis]